MNDGLKTSLSVLAAIVFLIPLQLAGGGYVLSFLWEWFLVPVFDISGITTVQGMGILTLPMLFTKSKTRSQEENQNLLESTDFSVAAGNTIGRIAWYFIVLAVAFGIKTFM